MSDVKAQQGSPRGGPKPVSARDWLFGYAPRRRLLVQLFGPLSQRAEISEKGLSGAQIAALAGNGRSTAKADISALEALGLVKRVRVGKRDRFIPKLIRASHGHFVRCSKA